ncbi:MAG TPA: prepilin-type N-terminal cleavage/methylation domain-containing protein [Spirochaetota bacterium]|nr:prepilin-type N-terminal cleavage/methylation domain-containing protein [Spirochaetota bacterium]
MWKKGKGFTLIELMVVIAIILILALIAIPAYRNMQDRAKRSRVQSDLRNLATNLEIFYTDWTKYPIEETATRLSDEGSVAGAELLGTGLPATTNVSGTTVTGESAPIHYIENATLLPKDPFGDNPNDSYYYQSDAAGQCWILYSKHTLSTGDIEYIYRMSDGTGGTVSELPNLPCE